MPLLKALDNKAELSAQTQADLQALQADLATALEADDRLRDCASKIISFGPKRSGPNVLISAVEGLECGSVWEEVQHHRKLRGDLRLENISSLGKETVPDIFL